MTERDGIVSSKTVLCCMFGGKSTEYEVSLASAYSVITNVNRDIFDVVTVGITKDGKWWLYTGDVENIRNDTWHSDEKYLTKVYLSLDYGDKEFVLVDKDGKT